MRSLTRIQSHKAKPYSHTLEKATIPQGHMSIRSLTSLQSTKATSSSTPCQGNNQKLQTHQATNNNYTIMRRPTRLQGHKATPHKEQPHSGKGSKATWPHIKETPCKPRKPQGNKVKHTMTRPKWKAAQSQGHRQKLLNEKAEGLQGHKATPHKEEPHTRTRQQYHKATCQRET